MPKFHLFVNNTKYETMEDKSDLSHTNGIMRSDDQDIKCGIFQGDLSSPFFCLAPIRFYCPLYLKKQVRI